MVKIMCLKIKEYIDDVILFANILLDTILNRRVATRGRLKMCSVHTTRISRFVIALFFIAIICSILAFVSFAYIHFLIGSLISAITIFIILVAASFTWFLLHILCIRFYYIKSERNGGPGEYCGEPLDAGEQ